jgi:pSer/pThr/pTyr-binding forkhead associated (FHA) protein
VARLRIVGGDGVERVVELRAGKLQIGRGRDSDIVLPDPEKGVSRTHAELRLEGDRYVIVDLQSQNGTWLNGLRVERAEVPFGTEIAVGAYRLTLLNDPPQTARVPAPKFRPDPLDDMRATERHDPPAFKAQLQAQLPAQPSAAMPRWIWGVAVVVFVIVALAAVAWVSGPRQGVAVTPPSSEPAAVAGDASPPAADVPSTSVPAERSATPAGDRQAEIADLAGSSPVKRSGEKTAAGVARTSDTPRIGRRPGESAEAWRARAAALQMRYGYSKVALDRGDFAAAAGGFEAILMEEPGFLDAPRLLVRAQAGLRASAASLFQAGNKLDAAGDWMGALQKYEQARQIYAEIPGLSDGLQRVRGKLRAAGTAAFNEARQHEANGRPQEALKEYEKALQWLSPDDPNRHIARARVEQLRRND